MTTAVVVSAFIAALSWFAYKALTTFFPSDLAKPAAVALIVSTIASFFIPAAYAGYLALATAMGTTAVNGLMARNYLSVPSGRPRAVKLGLQSLGLLILAGIAYWLATST